MLSLVNTKNGDFNWKGEGRITRQGKGQKSLRWPRWPGAKRSTGWLTGRPVRRAENLKRFPRLSFSPISSGASRLLPFQLPWRDFLRHYSLLRRTDLIVESRVFGFWDSGLRIWAISSSVGASDPASVSYRAWGLLGVCASLSSASSPSSQPFGWHLGESQLLPGLRASALLSHLRQISPRLAERRGTTPLFSALLKTTRDINKNLPSGK